MELNSTQKMLIDETLIFIQQYTEQLGQAPKASCLRRFYSRAIKHFGTVDNYSNMLQFFGVKRIYKPNGTSVYELNTVPDNNKLFEDFVGRVTSE